jgi:hypothetical protein
MAEQAIDYAALAAQARGAASPAAASLEPSAIDYSALAQQARGERPADFRAEAEQPSFLNLALEAAKGWASGMNPLPALKQMYGQASEHYKAADEAAKAGRYADVLKQNVAAVFDPPAAMASGVGQSHWNEIKKAKQAYDDGRMSEAVGHTLAALVPLYGPMAAQAGEMIGTGDPRTMARGAGLGLAALTPSALKYGTEAARTGSLVPTAEKLAAAKPVSVSVPALARNPNPVEAAAVDFGLERGIPVDVGAATGNPVARGARAVAENTSLSGAYLGNKARQAQGEAFARVGADLANDVHPTAVVPTQAGEGVRGAITELRDQLHAQANTAYDRLREIEQDPRLAERTPSAPAGSAAAKAISRKIAEGLGADTAPTGAELRELHRMLAEMDSVPYVKRTWVDRTGDVGKKGNAGGGDFDIVAGAAGAPVYDDILQAAPGTSDMTRGEVAKGIRSMLETGTVTNAGRGAIEVARARIANSSSVSRPILPPSAGDVAHPLGRLESVAFPVELTGVKKMLKPVLDQMRRQMPITQQQANPALKAIANIVEDSPNYAPLSQVDRDLSAIKAIARSQGGLAKMAVARLDEAVRAAAERGGPEAVQALEEGRSATIAKYGTEAVLDKLRTEPRQVFDQLTHAKDSSLEQLRAVREHAPAEMPKIGRAVLEELLSTAQAEGGFSKAQGIYAKWQNLGPQTKQILFGSPATVYDLDQFFLLAKKVAENPNPSGSAYVGALAAHGYLFKDPMAFMTWEIAGAGLSKLLRSPKAVRALTQGFKVPLSSPDAAKAAAVAITKAAAFEGVTPIAVPAAAGRTPPATDQSRR